MTHEILMKLLFWNEIAIIIEQKNIPTFYLFGPSQFRRSRMPWKKAIRVFNFGWLKERMVPTSGIAYSLSSKLTQNMVVCREFSIAIFIWGVSKFSQQCSCSFRLFFFSHVLWLTMTGNSRDAKSFEPKGWGEKKGNHISSNSFSFPTYHH